MGRIGIVIFAAAVGVSACGASGDETAPGSDEVVEIADGDGAFRLAGQVINGCSIEWGGVHCPGADLWRADLSRADLGRADLTRVMFCETTMPTGRERSDNCFGLG